MELVNLERQKHQITPDSNPREELQALESPSGARDGGLWLEMIEDGMFGDTIKDQLYALNTHAPKTAD